MHLYIACIENVIPYGWNLGFVAAHAKRPNTKRNVLSRILKDLYTMEPFPESSSLLDTIRSLTAPFIFKNGQTPDSYSEFL